MAVNDIYKVVLNSRLQEEPCTNRWFFRESTIIDGTPLDAAIDIAIEMLLRWRTEMLPLLSSQYEMVNVICNKVEPTKGPAVTRYAADTDVGAVIDDALPGLAAAVVAFQTDEGGPSKRGRTFIAGVPENAAIGGLLSDNFHSALDSALDDVFEDMTIGTGGEFTHTLWSEFLSEHEDVRFLGAKPAVGTQRRRRPRGQGFAADDS